MGRDQIVGDAVRHVADRAARTQVRDGRYHAWIERDDPQRLGRVGTREAWAFPSFFTQGSMVDDTTVSSLGCATRVITVANLDEPRSRISISSSQGPTRDGRQKPDVAAPGTNITAAQVSRTRPISGCRCRGRAWRARSSPASSG